jgi:hypothetical protein
MRHNYDVFEKFSDGSTLWRACVSGQYEAQRKMQELKESSENEFFTLNIHVHSYKPTNIGTLSRPAAKAVASGSLGVG